MPTTAPFATVAAFASNPNAGNPAAIVFLDLEKYPDRVYSSLSRNFNQPITSFVSPKPRPESNDKVLHYDIRYFVPLTEQEIPLCGHGTLAAGQVVLESEYATEQTEAIQFYTRTRGIVTVWKRPGGFLELSANSHLTSEPDRGQYAQMMDIIRRTFGKEVTVNYIGFGTHDFPEYMLVELDEKENLKELAFVNAVALRETGRVVHVFTTQCSNGPERFHSRMFAPGHLPGDEDPVCGTAHCLLTPYWSKKLGIPRGEEIQAKQVSQRGGDLKLVWDADIDKIHLRGKVTKLAFGEVFIPS